MTKPRPRPHSPTPISQRTAGKGHCHGELRQAQNPEHCRARRRKAKRSGMPIGPPAFSPGFQPKYSPVMTTPTPSAPNVEHAHRLLERVFLRYCLSSGRSGFHTDVASLTTSATTLSNSEGSPARCGLSMHSPASDNNRSRPWPPFFDGGTSRAGLATKKPAGFEHESDICGWHNR